MQRPQPAAACAHIAAFYQLKWEAHKCIAWNFLRKGYRQWAAGEVTDDFNDLFPHGFKRRKPRTTS